MSLYRFPLLGIFSVSFVLWLTASCNSDDDSKCVRGETRLCTCVGNYRGVQSCQADSSYDECDCTGTGIAGSSGNGGGEPEFRILVGRPCRADDECGEGLSCVTNASNDFFGVGGVAGGYCTKTCASATTEADCAAVDPDSECLEFNTSGAGLCFRTCLTHTPTSANEQKCLERPDLACASAATLFNEGVDPARTTGWCLPRCNSDLECPGRVCNLADGICRSQQFDGLPIGAPCTLDTDCAGRLCLDFDEDESVCSANCVYQGVAFSAAACGYSGAPREAGCLFPFQRSPIGSEGVGDYGVCLELCDTTADCSQIEQGWFCSLVPQVQTFSQRGGYCLPASALPPDAGAGDAGPADGGSLTDASTVVDGG